MWIVPLALAIGFAVTMIVLSATARRPTNLGVHDGRLSPCPGTPNCVCSQDDEPGHAIAPLQFSGPPDAAWQALRDAIARQPRVRVVADSAGYLHAEFTSLVFRFVDDAEFLLDAERKAIHVRSASRAGRSDLGVNRARVESLRRAFEEAQSAAQ